MAQFHLWKSLLRLRRLASRLAGTAVGFDLSPALLARLEEQHGPAPRGVLSLPTAANCRTLPLSRHEGRLVLAVDPGPEAFESLADLVDLVDDLLGNCAELRAREADRKEIRFLQQLLDAIPVPIFYKDADRIYRGCNEAFARYLGRDRDEIVGRHVTAIAPRDLAERYEIADLELLATGGQQIYESRVEYGDGTLRDVLFNKAVLHGEDGGIWGLVGTMLDITERKEAEEKLFFHAFHDALTGLPNRSLFMERLSQALAQAKRSGSLLAVAYLDLDRFKLVNDTLGHAVGDELLKAAADRLRSGLRESDTLARMGGDEFTLLLPGVPDARAVARACERILSALSQPFHVAGRELIVSASVGVALYPTDGDEAGLLLQRADRAMYRAKEAGKNCFRIYTPEMNEAVHSRLELESELHHALERGQFSIVYQPQIDLRSEEVIGFEALLRWHHPDLGEVPPSRFIPIAEESGQIVRIGRWVLEYACTQAARWQRMGHPRRRIAINVSARQLVAPDFVELVERVLCVTGLPHDLLEIELTETDVMRDAEEAVVHLEQLRRLGVRIAVDDFGTGLSSLSRLQRLPIDRVKIDRSFIADLHAERSTLPLAQGIVTLAHALGLGVVAEGVETREQACALAALGCEVGQGWYFGRPVRDREVVERYGRVSEVA